jgi:hypothetical protein
MRHTPKRFRRNLVEAMLAASVSTEFGTVSEDTMTAQDEPPQDALGRLQWSWGSAYGIAGAWSNWVARRRDTGRVLHAESADGLRALILRDYQDQPVPREVAP